MSDNKATYWCDKYNELAAQHAELIIKETRLTARIEELELRNAMLIETLEKLARLGNGREYGNSVGNMIAIDALSATSAQSAAWLESKIAERLGEPVAHIYPSDLERFETQETFATVFSVAVGCPDENSVPLYALPTKVAAS